MSWQSCPVKSRRVESIRGSRVQSRHVKSGRVVAVKPGRVASRPVSLTEFTATALADVTELITSHLNLLKSQNPT